MLVPFRIRVEMHFLTDPHKSNVAQGGRLWIYDQSIFYMRISYLKISKRRKHVLQRRYLFFMYLIQHCFICRPSDSTASRRRILGSNPGLLRLWQVLYLICLGGRGAGTSWAVRSTTRRGMMLTSPVSAFSPWRDGWPSFVAPQMQGNILLLLYHRCRLIFCSFYAPDAGIFCLCFAPDAVIFA